MARQHFTAMEKRIDMSALVARNGDAIALGNARMNARGDIVTQRGLVLKTQEQIEAEWKRAKDRLKPSSSTNIKESKKLDEDVITKKSTKKD